VTLKIFFNIITLSSNKELERIVGFIFKIFLVKKLVTLSESLKM